MNRISFLACAFLAGCSANTEVDRTSKSGQVAVGNTYLDSLTPGSEFLSDGTPYALWPLQAEPGTAIQVTMASSEFDTYLIVVDSQGETIAENDNANGTTDAEVFFVVPSNGVVEIVANAAQADFGSYELTTTPAFSNTVVATLPTQTQLRLDQPNLGELTPASPTLSDGSSYQRWTFTASAGDPVSVEMASVAFDTALRVNDRYGNTVAENDDASGSTTDSSIAFIAPEDGQYTVIATAYSSNQYGPYELTLSTGTPELLEFATGGDPADRYALLIGVAEYPNPSDNLPAVAGDIDRMNQVLLEEYDFKPENIVILEDNEATRANIITAFSQHLGQAGQNGTALFYYSGHGTQLDGNVGLTGPIDPEEDGRDEALYVYDGELLDDEVGTLIDRLRAEHIVVVFDSCFSGAATRDVFGKSKEVSIESVRDAVGTPKAYLGTKAAKVAPQARTYAYAEFRNPTRHVYLAASAEDQLSWIGPDEMEGSVFTYYLARELRSAGGGDSFENVMQRAAEPTYQTVLDLYGEEQSPRAEGSRSSDLVADYLAR
ncbi:MAG: caspase family protein [Pseudomonadota bacterium]